MIIYNNDFSTNPFWLTDQSENFYWDDSLKAFVAKTFNQVPEFSPKCYAFVDINLDVTQSFSISWDQLIVGRDGYAMSHFGLFGDDFLTHEYLPFPQLFPESTFNVGLGAGPVGAGPFWEMNIYTATFPDQGVSGSGNGAEEGIWYTSVLSFDASTSEVTWMLSYRETGQVAFSITTPVNGEFLSSMNNLAIANNPTAHSLGSVFNQDFTDYLITVYDNVLVVGEPINIGTVVQRVSIATDGTEGNGSSGGSLAISGDGRYVVFASMASNLTVGDTNGVADIFVHDRIAHTTERLPIGEAIGNAISISANGRFIAFDSADPNIVSGDTNFKSDAFVYDRVTQATQRISLDPDGAEFSVGAGIETNAISADGRYVLFGSSAEASTPGRIYLRDLVDQTTTLVVADATAIDSDHSFSISGDGRYVVYDRYILGPGNKTYVYDRVTRLTEPVSVTPDGTLSDGRSENPGISADGRFVVFQSTATNIVSNDTNGATDIFLYDRFLQESERISVSSDGTQGNSFSALPSISADGRYVAFVSGASNLVADDTNGLADVFVRDRLTHTTTRVSVTVDGAGGNGDSSFVAISANGAQVAFTSSASNLVVGDTNSEVDIFVATFGPATDSFNEISLLPNQFSEEMARFSSSAYSDQAFTVALGSADSPTGNWSPVLELSVASGVFNQGVFRSSDGRAWAHLYAGSVQGAKTLVVAFRGTDDLASDILDYTSHFADHWARFQPLISSVDNYIISHQIQNVYVTGHSLGGAMAQTFMRTPHPVAAYKAATFGSPGADGTVNSDPRIIHYEHVDDPVPDLGRSIGNVPIGRMVVIDVTGNGLTAFGEHDAQLYVESIGLLTSIDVQLQPFSFGPVPWVLYIGDDAEDTYDPFFLFRPVGREALFGMDGNDRLIAGQENDILVGGDGNDTLDGGEAFDIARYSGARNVHMLTWNGPDVAVFGPEGSDTLRNIERIQFSDSVVEVDNNSLVDPSIITSFRSNFNGDRKSDVLIRHDNGTIEFRFMDGGDLAGYRDDPIPTYWDIVGLDSDFNADGKSDVVLRHENGTIEYRIMDGGNLTAFKDDLIPNYWQIVSASSDLNGDGKSDVVLRHENGTIEYRLMDGVNMTSYKDDPIPTYWRVLSTNSDFNDDGKSDLVIRHDNGTIEYRLMNGVELASYKDDPIPNYWHVISTNSDFNGDGKSDLVIRHDNGTIEYRLMDGVKLIGYKDELIPSYWHVVSTTSDFNGDGKSDVVLRHDNGTVEYRLMDGVNMIAYKDDTILTHWDVIGADSDFNGDGKSDVLLRHANGTFEYRFMDGLNMTTFKDSPIPTYWHLVSPDGDWQIS